MRYKILFLFCFISLVCCEIPAQERNNGSNPGFAERNKQNKNDLPTPVKEKSTPDDWRSRLKKINKNIGKDIKMPDPEVYDSRYPSENHPEENKLRKLVPSILKWAYEQQTIQPLFEKDLVYYGAKALVGEERKTFINSWHHRIQGKRIKKAKPKSYSFFGEFARVKVKVVDEPPSEKSSKEYEPWLEKDRNDTDPKISRNSDIYYIFFKYNGGNWKVHIFDLKGNKFGLWKHFFEKIFARIETNRTHYQQTGKGYIYTLHRNYTKKYLHYMEAAFHQKNQFPIGTFCTLLKNNSLTIRKYVHEKLINRYKIDFGYSKKILNQKKLTFNNYEKYPWYRKWSAFSRLFPMGENVNTTIDGKIPYSKLRDFPAGILPDWKEFNYEGGEKLKQKLTEIYRKHKGK